MVMMMMMMKWGSRDYTWQNSYSAVRIQFYD